jgi:hypothetical protein
MGRRSTGAAAEGPAASSGSPPIWPDNKTCGDKGHGVYDAYSISPDHCDSSNNCDPGHDLNDPIIYNSCTMVCMLGGFHNVAEKHGMHFGGTCFDDNAIETDHFGTDVVCPGASFSRESKYAGIRMFTYKCTGGTVIDYGGPYK